jgi:isopenicillin-N N-acyltransferase-like protein
LLVEAVGDRAAVGEAIGRQARDLIRRATRLVYQSRGFDESLSERLHAIEQRLADAIPRVLDEVRGVAAGAGIEYEDALMLSVGSEIGGVLPGYCSLIGCPNKGGVVLSKNLDAPRALGPLQIVERIELRGGLRFLHVTTAGAIWSDGGINEAGLGLVNASLVPRNGDPNGLPDGILAREILLRCEDVKAAVALSEAYPFGIFGENLIIGDTTGRVVLIEKLPRARQYVHEGGVQIATNHTVSAALSDRISTIASLRQNSETRRHHLSSEFSRAGAVTVTRLREVLAGHTGRVCQHGADGLWTIASLIASPADGRLRVALGPPCVTKHQVFELSRRGPTLHVREKARR